VKQEYSAAFNIILLGTTIIALAVIIGAFGAHGLKNHLSEYQLSIFETGNRYHFYHGFGILIIASLSSIIPSKNLKLTCALLIIGVLLFSGSLYLLATRELLGISHWKFLGPLTPIGGVFFIVSWTYLGWTAYCTRKDHSQS